MTAHLIPAVVDALIGMASSLITLVVFWEVAENRDWWRLRLRRILWGVGS